MRVKKDALKERRLERFALAFVENDLSSVCLENKRLTVLLRNIRYTCIYAVT